MSEPQAQAPPSEVPPADDQATLVKQAIQPVQIKEKAQNNRSDVQQSQQQSFNQSQSQDSLKNKVDLASSIVNDGQMNSGQLRQLQQQNEEQQNKITLIPDDFYYEDDHTQNVVEDSPIPGHVTQIDGFFGYDSFKRYNPKVLDRDSIIYSSGITYTIYNHSTKESQRFFSKDKGGIGCIAVSKSRKYFAVGELGTFPNVYIYEYPSLKLHRILRKGTQKTYSCMCFSNDDEQLVTVGGNPDFLITIWEWRQEKLMLKSKAFSQDVYNVSFSQFNQSLLTTSGTGHIRFWKIAETFTGLKLQGDIGKFGQFQLSDVVSYAQFEDTNVLSSSQYGKLLLWEGNLIKSVIGIDQDTPCHKGTIEFVKLLRGKDKQLEIVSAGSDGYIRFWNFEEINLGESDEFFNLYVKPTKQIYFETVDKQPAWINWIEMYSEKCENANQNNSDANQNSQSSSADFWLVQDAHGTLYKYQLATDARTVIMTFNSGRFTDMAMSPLNNCCITTGYDGAVRIWDYGNKKQFFSRKFVPSSGKRAEALCLQWLPFSKRNNGRMLAVGFGDGIVRFLGLQKASFQLIKAMKVHRHAVNRMKVSRDGSVLAVSDTSGAIFFLQLDSVILDKITPYCLLQTGYKINDMCFNKVGDRLLLACQDGKIHELTVPKESQCDYTQSYLRPHIAQSFTIKMMQSQKPKKEDLQLQLLLKKTKGGNMDQVIVDQEWQPAAVLNATYYDSDCTKILCSAQGKFLNNYYIVQINKQRPVGSIAGSMNKTSYLQYNEQSDMLFIGYKNGSWEVRHKYNPNLYAAKHGFDHNYGIVRRVAMNLESTALIALSEDGTMISYKFDHSAFLKGAKGDEVELCQVNLPPVILGINEATFADKVEFTKKPEEDITDSQVIYGLQDEKLKAEEDMKLTQAEKVKLQKHKKVKQLRALYAQVLQANKSEADYLARLTPQELIIDADYSRQLKERVEQQVQQTKKVMRYDEYKAELAKKKLQKYFLEQLEFDSFRVKGIKKENLVVSSFKMKKLSPYIQRQLAQIERIIQQQKRQELQMGATGIGNLNVPRDKKDRTMSQFEHSKAMMQMAKQMKQTGTAQKKLGNKQDQNQDKEVKNKIREAEQEFQKQLQHAESTMGDYKLKCAHDYDVPQNERLNVSRKKKHLFLHYQYLFLQKKEFNSRLDTLRKKKRSMIDRLDQVNGRLRAINKELELNESDFYFALDGDIELMETDFEVTEADIQEYVIQKEKEKNAAKKGSGGGMGMGGGNTEVKDDSKDQAATSSKDKNKVIKNQRKEEHRKPTAPVYAARKNLKTKKSALAQQAKQIRQIQLQTEKNQIKKKLQNDIFNFDKQLEDLRVYKYHLQNDLTIIEMKLLTYTQQFIIFRDMQTYDNQLMTSLKNYSTDKQGLQTSFINLSTEISQIQQANQQLKRKFEDEKKILKEFVYPEDDDMRERIIRYYKIRERKRIQKLKKQAEMQERQKESDGQDDQDEDQDDYDDSDESDEESQDEFEDEQQKPDINVIENDHKNFERVRKICEYDEKIEQNSRRKSDLEKQRHQISNKIKNIDNELIKAEKQLKIYQKKKLLKINQLYVSLPIKFSQVQHLVKVNGKYRIQEDFSNAILFTYSSFTRLTERIDELKKQKIDIEKKQKNLNKKLFKLTEQVGKASHQIQAKRKDYEQKQLLKFGSTFELQKLKELQPTGQVLDMRAMYKKQQKDASKKVRFYLSKQIQQIKQELQERKRQLLQTKKLNTKVITEITQLGNTQNELKKKLDSTNKQLFKSYDMSKKDELQKERQNLKDLIKFLSKEIEDLKTEIGLFKRKGGHIYTMVTSNKKNFS